MADEKKHTFWSYLKFLVTNKLFVAFLLFLIYSLFITQHNWIERVQTRLKIKETEKELNYYKEKIENDSKQIEIYNSNPEAIERLAREKYFMKQPNEDVFVVE